MSHKIEHKKPGAEPTNFQIKKATHAEFLKKVAETCKKAGGCCQADENHVIVDVRLYDVRLK